MRRKRLALALGLAALALGAAGEARAFNWNGKTALHEVDLIDGRMETESGHPLATRRAFLLAAERAGEDPELAAALERVLREGPEGLQRLRSDAMQTVLFGSWLNEIRTNIDATGSLALDLAAKFLRWRYADYLDGRVHSDRWQEDTGYSSSNYQHSMMVSSSDPARTIGQDEVFELIQEYVFWANTSAVMNLAIAAKGLEEGALTADDADLNWISGLRFVGSVFHVLEDSAVACTPAAQEALAERERECIPGDGHGVVALTASGRRRVVSLSNNHFYERKLDAGGFLEGSYSPHAVLDDLYREENLQAVYGDFDPALVTSEVLAEVALGVDEVLEATEDVPLFKPDGTPNDEFDAVAFSTAADVARRIDREIVGERYASAEERRPLPPLEDGGKGDDLGPGDRMPAGGCSASGPAAPAAPGGLLLALGLVAVRRKRGRSTASGGS